VHLILVPSGEAGLARAVGQTHVAYTRRINFRKKWRGFLWQGRFASCVMDEPHRLLKRDLTPKKPGPKPKKPKQQKLSDIVGYRGTQYLFLA